MVDTVIHKRVSLRILVPPLSLAGTSVVVESPVDSKNSPVKASASNGTVTASHSSRLCIKALPGLLKRTAVLIVALLVLSSSAMANIRVVDFESFSSLESITNQIPGLTFTNATVLTAGISLNEIEFPPHSGSNVVFDDGGPMTITFGSPTDVVGGYFNYTEPFTLTAFDASDTQVAMANSLFSSNDALFGDTGSSPNEYISVFWASGISSVVLEAVPGGSSFTLDDLSYNAATPEPSYAALASIGLLTLVAAKLHRTRSAARRATSQS
jgi:hypothetical protein